MVCHHPRCQSKSEQETGGLSPPTPTCGLNLHTSGNDPVGSGWLNDNELALTPLALTPLALTPLALTPLALTHVALTHVALTPLALTPLALTPLALAAKNAPERGQRVSCFARLRDEKAHVVPKNGTSVAKVATLTIHFTNRQREHQHVPAEYMLEALWLTRGSPQPKNRFATATRHKH